MHSSQNEQDNRQFAKFARIPCLDPADSQDTHDLTLAAFDLSEQFDTPVLLRMTTRVCHTSSPVEVGEQRDQPARTGQIPAQPDQILHGAGQSPASATRSSKRAWATWPNLPRPSRATGSRWRSLRPGNYHRRGGLQLCPRGFPGGQRLEAWHGLPAAARMIARFCGARRKADRAGRAGSVHRRPGAPDGHPAVPPGRIVPGSASTR